MHDWYNHIDYRKKIDCRANKQPSEPYFEYDPNPINLTQRKSMAEKEKPDAIVRHTISAPLTFAFYAMGIYYIAKLIFFIYNDGNVLNIILNGNLYGN